jgi:transcriptional regulator with XRE-family HTH domain
MSWTVSDINATFLRQMQEHREDVGRRLRDLRKARGLNQEDAAHAVGVAVKTWSNWERGRTAPYDSNWKRIGQAFDVDPVTLQGTPPTPLGLGGDSGDIESRVASMEDRLAGLIEMQNSLLARQSEILEQIQAEQKAIRRLVSTQESAVEGMYKAAEMMRAVKPVPSPGVEPPTKKPAARKPATAGTRRSAG